MSAKKIWALVIAALLVIGIVSFTAYEINSGTQASEISKEDARSLVNEAFDKMALASPVKFIAKENNITVNEMKHGDEKNIILSCTVETYDVYNALKDEYDSFLSSDIKKANGTMFKSALDFKKEFEGRINELIKDSEKITQECEIQIFDTKEGFVVYSSEEVIDIVYGGVNKIKDEVSRKKTYTLPGGEERKIQSGNVNKGFINAFELRYSSSKPDTANAFLKAWNKVKSDFHKNFIEHARWKTIFRGLWVTIRLTFFSLLIGIILGFIVAFVRTTYIKLEKHGFFLSLINGICQLYLTITRGTPVVVQIMIIYFVLFMPLGVDKFIAAVICFGLNSGAYVAEIVRGGIMSVDEGQTEAGRSLGFNYISTMRYIVFPQAFKTVLPALANEFVVLLKETSIAFYIGLGDLMYSVNAIRAATYSPFMPLIASAVIYLVMVLVLSKLVSILERRLRNNER